MITLQQIYIGCTVFSVGITALDFLGILGGSRDGEDHSGDGDYGADLDVTALDHGTDSDAAALDTGSELDAGDFDLGGDADGDDVSHSDHTEDFEAQSHHGGGVAILSILSYLRSFVYFCLGFGPTGWVALATGRSLGNSFMWALPAGAIAFVLARTFFRFQRSDTDSSLMSDELLFQRGTVIVPLSHDAMGKVRIHVGMNVTEQYALSAEPSTEFRKGDTVWITNVTDEHVYVEDILTRKE